MAALALVTADVVEVFDSVKEKQKSAPCAVVVVAGNLVRLNADGQWILAESGAAATLVGVYFAAFSRQIGQGLTGFKEVKADGFNIDALAFGASVFANPAGAIGDAAGVASLAVGRVIPGWSNTVGNPAKKILQIDIPL